MPCFGQAKNLGQGAPFVAEAGKPLLVSFLCNHCPKTVPLRPAISVLFEEFGEAVSFVAVMSNDLLYCPMDGPEDMAKEQKEFGWNLPYLMDEDQSVAKAFSASLTHEFFLYDCPQARVPRRSRSRWYRTEGSLRGSARRKRGD
jgi:hypothetical protein